tara:strand:- start:323 stop:1495 length:1173 start_codon:yes stop_codon:yes gene_type:complete
MAGTITIKGGLSSVIKNDENDNLIIMTNSGNKSIFINGSGSGDAQTIYTGSSIISRDKGTGLLTEKVLVGGKELIKSASVGLTGTGEVADNQIEMFHTANNSFITVSGSDPGYNIIHTTTGAFSKWRGKSLTFVSASEIRTIGINTDKEFVLQDNETIGGVGTGVGFRWSPDGDAEDVFQFSGSANVSGSVYSQNLYVSASGESVVQVGNDGTNLSKWEWHRDGVRKWVIYNDGRTNGIAGQDSLVFKHGISSDGDDHINFYMKPDDQTVYFHGDISASGTISATRKSFVIDHPDIPGKKLHHGSLEGPEFGVYVRGKVENDNKVTLPEYWGSLVDEDSISVHITPIGRHILPLYFKKIEDNCVYVNKKSNFYYYICGERKDIKKLEIIQ